MIALEDWADERSLEEQRELFAACPYCGAKPDSIDPLPEGWWWDCAESEWAWCPDCDAMLEEQANDPME